MTRQEKTAKANIRFWKQSTDNSLYTAYGRHSSKKDHAWYYCEQLCKKLNGTDLKVVSHNSFVFTAGFQFVDAETGVIRYMHITPSSNTVVDM